MDQDNKPPVEESPDVSQYIPQDEPVTQEPAEVRLARIEEQNRYLRQQLSQRQAAAPQQELPQRPQVNVTALANRKADVLRQLNEFPTDVNELSSEQLGAVVLLQNQLLTVDSQLRDLQWDQQRSQTAQSGAKGFIDQYLSEQTHALYKSPQFKQEFQNFVSKSTPEQIANFMQQPEGQRRAVLDTARQRIVSSWYERQVDQGLRQSGAVSAPSGGYNTMGKAPTGQKATLPEYMPPGLAAAYGVTAEDFAKFDNGQESAALQNGVFFTKDRK